MDEVLKHFEARARLKAYEFKYLDRLLFSLPEKAREYLYSMLAKPDPEGLRATRDAIILRDMHCVLAHAKKIRIEKRAQAEKDAAHEKGEKS